MTHTLLVCSLHEERQRRDLDSLKAKNLIAVAGLKGKLLGTIPPNYLRD